MMRRLLPFVWFGCGQPSPCGLGVAPEPGEFLVLDAVDPRLVGTVAEIRETEAGLVLVLRYVTHQPRWAAAA